MSKPKRNPNEKIMDTVASVFENLDRKNCKSSYDLKTWLYHEDAIKRGLRMAYMAGRRHEAARMRREFKEQQEKQ